MTFHGILLFSVFVVLVKAEDGETMEAGKRIIEGQALSRGEASWLVSLHFLGSHPFIDKSGLKHVCGGTLIAPQWVVTAGHCVSEMTWPGLGNVSLWSIKLGEHNLTENESLSEQVFTISQIFLHPDYNRSYFYTDIALLKLDRPAAITDYVGMIDWYSGNESCAVEGTTCQVFGWGQRAEVPFGYGSETPFKATVRLTNMNSCKEIYSSIVEGFQFCAIGDNTTTSANVDDGCLGDSGGPIVCTCNGAPHLTGIISEGIRCGVPGIPGVYVRTRIHRDFIQKTMAENS